MKILVSITSFHESKIPFLSQIIQNYANISKKNNIVIDILLSTNYNHSFKNKHITSHKITKYKEEQEFASCHCWENKQTLYDFYKKYDYSIESDDDILISFDNIKYYVNFCNQIDFNYIPGFLVTEIDKNKNQVPITLIPDENYGETKDNYFLPSNFHSACNIVDKKRMDIFVKKTDNYLTPKPYKQYGAPEMSRSEIYTVFQKCIDINNIKESLVKHLPNKYVNGLYDDRYFPTPIHHKYRDINYWEQKIKDDRIFTN